jgi:SAM-dependent methyltransferase
MAYEHWAATYELFEGETAQATWQQGIVAELRSLTDKVHRVLDLGAGTGIGGRCIQEAFPEAEVFNMDYSGQMLDKGGVPKRRQLVGDMSEFSTTGDKFDFVVSGFDAFNYLPEEKLYGCLCSVTQCLADDGYLVFDYSTRKVLKYDWGDLDYVNQVQDYELRRTHRYELLLDRSKTVLELRHAGEVVWTETHYQYAIDPFTMEELARSAGLTVVRVRDIDAESFSPTKTTHLYTCRKETSS